MSQLDKLSRNVRAEGSSFSLVIKQKSLGEMKAKGAQEYELLFWNAPFYKHFLVASYMSGSCLYMDLEFGEKVAHQLLYE